MLNTFETHFFYYNKWDPGNCYVNMTNATIINNFVGDISVLTTFRVAYIRIFNHFLIKLDNFTIYREKKYYL